MLNNISEEILVLVIRILTNLSYHILLHEALE